LIVMNGAEQTSWPIPAKFNSVSDVTFNEDGSKIVFTASLDTSKIKSYLLFYADLEKKSFSKLIDTIHSNLPLNARVSSHYKPFFSKDHKNIYFGIADKKQIESKDTLLENEKAKVDIWSWKDDRLQPQ
jgi:Tol biopolymer transport system component